MSKIASTFFSKRLNVFIYSLMIAVTCFSQQAKAAEQEEMPDNTPTLSKLKNIKDLTPAEKAKINKGEVVQFRLLVQVNVKNEKKEIEGAQAFAKFDAPIEVVWETLIDYPSYPKWMQGVAAVLSLKKLDERVTLLGLEVESPMKNIKYVQRRIHTKPTQIYWTRESGDLEYVDAGWDLEKVDDKTTMARYYGIIDPGVWVPKFIRRLFTSNNLERLMNDANKESKKRYQAATKPVVQ